MNNNSYIEIKNPAELQEAINQLKSSLKVLNDIFSSQNKNVERINSTPVWSGAASEAVYFKYKQLNANYNQISYSIDLYIKFLEKTLEDYNRLIKEQAKNIDAMAENLDVNS